MIDGYAIASIHDLERPDGAVERPDGAVETAGNLDSSRGLTELLGCSSSSVEAYRIAPGGSIDIPEADEQLCVPIGEDWTATLDDGIELSPSDVVRIPAGVASTLRFDTDASVFVVGAPATSRSEDGPVVVDLESCPFVEPSTSTIRTARLTARLGLTGMKVNARILDPGQWVPYHTEGDQEELFVPVRGPASMRIDDERFETPVGTIVRVAPPVPRSAVNSGDREALWLMIGAPPTGGPTEWDPGAEILE